MAVIVLGVREPGLERPWRMPLHPLPALFALVVNIALGVLAVLAWLVRRGTRAANREQV